MYHIELSNQELFLNINPDNFEIQELMTYSDDSAGNLKLVTVGGYSTLSDEEKAIFRVGKLLQFIFAQNQFQ